MKIKKQTKRYWENINKRKVEWSILKIRQGYKDIRAVLEIFCTKNTLFIKKMPQSPKNIADKYVKQKVLEMQTELNK